MVFDYAHGYPEAILGTSGWIRKARLETKEDTADGLEEFSEVVLMFFGGCNTGKLVLHVANAL